LTDKYAVIGNPIAHSKSPQIHAAFAKQTGQDISYESILSPLDGFAETIKNLVALGVKAANVTVPFKFEAFNLCDELSDRAQAAGAVNTLTFDAGKIIGDNTDGAGIVSDIVNNLKMTLQSKRVLLLGAGGAAQGVTRPLLEQHVDLVVANRTLEKAEQMVSKFVGFTHLAQASTFGGLQGQFDVIINATSTGLSDTALPITDSIFAKNCLAYEMMYGRETPFMAQARRNGAQVTDGLGMLVEQAAEAFFVWRGVRPNTQAVIQQLSTKIAI
jgi:shikimate dehydrogenase